MRNILVIIFLSISFLFSGCNKDPKKDARPKIIPVNKLYPVNEIKIKKVPITALDNLSDRISKRSKNENQTKKTFDTIDNTKSKRTESIEEATEKLNSFFAIRKILAECKIGETFTQKELSRNFEIPKEAIRLVKSVTKRAENEIEVKWHSTWFIEKISDAKFKDGLMKVTFKADKIYTSGSAIGIKYNKKIYNDLIIIGHSAYIPNVKGYHWKIGK